MTFVALAPPRRRTSPIHSRATRRAITYRVRWLAPLIAVALATRALAAPTVDIKAQSQLSLDRVRLIAEGVVEVRGTLADRLTGEVIPDQTVSIRIGPSDDGSRGVGLTGRDGKFRTTLYGVPAGPQEIELSFPGTDLVDRAEPFVTTTDPARAQVALAIRAEEAAGGANLIVTATVDDRPAELEIELSHGAPGADLKPLTKTRSGTPFLLTRARAGGPGTQRVRAAYPGDATRQPATAEVTFDLASATKTTLEVSSTSIAYEDDLVATGKVTDEEGRPVARAAVALLTGDRRLAQGATDADGAYRFEVEADVINQSKAPGQFGIRVRAEPSAPTVRPSDSPPVIIKIAAPQPVPVSYTVAAFLATALAAGGFFTARAKPWRRFRRPAPPAEAPANGGAAEPTDGGLVVNRPGLVSTLRRPSDDGFSGAVRDTVRGRPVPDAVVRVILPDGDREQPTGADGSFTFERLPNGELRAEVAAPGFITERFAVTIPHRGELRGVRVDLVPVRERVFQLYRRAAEPILPEPRLWGIWSPRQIVDHVRAKRPSPALSELTDFVEEVYFSQRVASETVLPQAAQRVDQAIHERAARIA